VKLVLRRGVSRADRLGNVGFIAQYDSGHCTSCNQPIKAGDEIEEAHISSQVVRRYFHVACAAEKEAAIICSICGKQFINCEHYDRPR
jgi:hypothetical protein